MNEEIKARIAAINSGIVPDGYKKTKVGIVPEEWEIVNLSEIGKNYIGLTYTPEDTTQENGLLVLRSSNIINSKIDLSDGVYVKCDVKDNNRVKTNDILICARNGSSHLIGKSALITKEFNGLAFGAFMSVFRTNYYEYTFQIFQSTLIKKQIFSNLGARINQITTADVNHFKIPFPPLPEQQKIAEILSTQDKLIELQEKKTEQLKELKKGYLQKMFPKKGSKYPELRFKGFTDAWEQRKFSDFAQRESAVEVSSPDCPSVEYEDVIAEEGRLNKDIRLKETQKTGIKFDGTQVLYGKLRPYLHNWLNPDFTGVAVGDWWVLRPICIDKDYLYRLIQTKQFDDVANQSAGSKMPRADWNLISNTEFFVPISMEEQSKIAQAFADLDTLITLHQRKLEQEKQKKKSLMQLLLTGKVRVKL